MYATVRSIYNMHKIVKLYDCLCIHIIYRIRRLFTFLPPLFVLYTSSQPTETKTRCVRNNRIYYRFIYDTASIPAR